MKVLLLNGSSHTNGTTNAALEIYADILQQENIDTEIIQLGANPLRDCIQCQYCKTHGECVFKDDGVNDFLQKAKKADGFVFASPVYYAHASGRILSFLDRVFYAGKDIFQGKPGSALAVCRRAGTIGALRDIEEYFGISGMPQIPSTYWNLAFGNTKEELHQDAEGIQTIQNNARNMAWMIQLIDANKESHAFPTPIRKVSTNFIR